MTGESSNLNRQVHKLLHKSERSNTISTLYLILIARIRGYTNREKVKRRGESNSHLHKTESKFWVESKLRDHILSATLPTRLKCCCHGRDSIYELDSARCTHWLHVYNNCDSIELTPTHFLDAKFSAAYIYIYMMYLPWLYIIFEGQYIPWIYGLVVVWRMRLESHFGNISLPNSNMLHDWDYLHEITFLLLMLIRLVWPV